MTSVTFGTMKLAVTEWWPCGRDGFDMAPDASHVTWGCKIYHLPAVRAPVHNPSVAFRVQRSWFEARLGAFLVTGRHGGEFVRFAVTQSALDAYGWNSCLEEAFRRLEAGARDFCIAPAPASVSPVDGWQPDIAAPAREWPPVAAQ